jgi:hypothetical protein
MSHILALLDPEVYNRNRIPDEDWKNLRAPMRAGPQERVIKFFAARNGSQ